MTCPICSLYFQDIEQEAFRHHAFSRHSSAAVIEGLKANGVAWKPGAAPAAAETNRRDPESKE